MFDLALGDEPSESCSPAPAVSLRAAAGHRLFPLLWVAAMTGMRRNEVLGLKWGDIDFTKARLSLNRGLSLSAASV